MSQLSTTRAESDPGHMSDTNEVHRLHNKLDDSIGTKGDVFVHDGTSWVQLAVGTNDYALVADSAQASGVKWAAQSGGGTGLTVTRLTVDTTLTGSGIYIVDSSAAVRTVTLPALSAVTSSGMIIKIKREGANFVDIVRAGADEFEPGSITTRRLFTNWSALSIAADSAANYWYDLGYYGAIT